MSHWWHLLRLVAMQAKVRSAQAQISNIELIILYDIVYIQYRTRYRILYRYTISCLIFVYGVCPWCFSCFRFTCMASCRDIPGGSGPFKGIGRYSNALSRSSGVMFIQSGMPFKHCAIVPVAPVGICPAGISWSMKSQRSSKSISRSSLLSPDGGPGTVGTLGPGFGSKSHISAPTLYAISGTILGTL